MTRATLLHLLAHPTALTGADVRALEALAETFPYCQTAHLLLAKAAHDQDSMLAGQRLRRAATYAADRTLLRQLIEQQPAVAESVTATATFAAAVATQGGYADPAPPAVAPAALAAASPALLPLADYPSPELLAAPAPAPASHEAPAEVAVATTPAAPADTAPALLESPESVVAAVALPTPDSSASPPADQVIAVEAAPSTATEATVAPAAEVAPDTAPAEATPALTITEAAPEPAAPTSPTEPPVTNAAEAAEASQVESGATDLAPEQVPELAADILLELPAEPELPPQAPPVRPPEQAEAARHEFGLAPPEAAELAPYRLPGLELELAITVPLAAAPATPRLPAFSGVPDVAYAPGEGSRLGFCLVPSAEAVPDQVPPTRLPPAGEFFAPDALLTEYVAAPPTPAANPLDLIDSFLQRNAAAPRRRPQAPALGQQADLSARSTRAVPELASESLALILVRQGKIEQAITIYERLMVKNPEKMAYFAAQIDQLRPSA